MRPPLIAGNGLCHDLSGPPAPRRPAPSATRSPRMGVSRRAWAWIWRIGNQGADGTIFCSPRPEQKRSPDGWWLFLHGQMSGGFSRDVATRWARLIAWPWVVDNSPQITTAQQLRPFRTKSDGRPISPGPRTRPSVGQIGPPGCVAMAGTAPGALGRLVAARPDLPPRP